MTNQKKEELKKLYYDWQWKGRPSEDPEDFYPGKTNREVANFFISQFDKIINEKIVQIELKKIERQGAYNTADIKLGEMKGLDLAITILKE